jgi:hypothetical protein
MLLGPSRRPEGTRAVLSADGAYKLTRDRLIKPPPSSKFAPLAIRGTWRCVFPLVCISIRTDGARRIRAGNSADQCKLGDGGLISCSALVGWLADLPLLTNWEPDFVTMKPATALAILLIALDLLPQLSGAPRLLQPGHRRPRPLGRRPRVCGLSLNLALANHATGTTGGRLSCQGSVKGASLLVICTMPLWP